MQISLDIDLDYMEETFKSCQEVSSPSTGGVLLDAVCGEYASAYCTPER